MKGFFLAAMMLFAVSGYLAAASERISDGLIEVNGPVVVGYFPPVTQEELDDPNSGAGEGIAHVRFAVEDTLRCLEDSGIKAQGRVKMKDVLEVREGNATKRIKLPTSWPEAAGVYLFSPGKNPRKVPAQAGPSSLEVLVPEAAAEYYGAKACSTD